MIFLAICGGIFVAGKFNIESGLLVTEYWPRSTQDGGFQPFLRRTSELTFGVSVRYRLDASVHIGWLMLRNFIGTIGRQWAQPSRPTTTGPVTSEQLAGVSPAFEAWLQAYRRRLEEGCERASSRAVSV